MVADEVYIALGLKTNKFEQGLKNAASAVSTFSIAVGSALGNIFGGLVQEAFRTIPRIFSTMKEEAKALDDINKKTGASIENIAAWGNAVELSGGSVKAFQGTLLHLYNDMSRFNITGRGRNVPFLKALGIDPQSLKGKEIFDVIGDITKAVEGMDKQQSTFALKNLGFDPDTIKLIQSGKKNIDELIAKQKEWGVYTKKDIEAIDKMDKAVKQIRNTLKTALIPIFGMVVDAFSKGIRYVVDGISYLRKNTYLLRGAFLLLIPAIAKFGLALMLTPIGALITGLTILGLLLEDLWVYAKNGKTAFGDIWKQLGDPKEIMEGFESAGRTLKRFFTFLSELFPKMGKEFKFILMLAALLASAIISIPVAVVAALAVLIRYWEDIEKFFTDLPGAIEDAWDAGSEAVLLIARGLWQLLVDIFNAGVNAVNETWEGIKDAVRGAWDSIIATFQSAIDTVVGLWDGLVGAFNSGCSAIAGFLSNAANTARRAWESFISWLEKKWNWLKDLLPSFESIANKLPKVEGSAKLAVAGAGGGTTNISNVNDNRKVDVHNHTDAASTRSMKEMGLVGFANTGNKQ